LNLGKRGLTTEGRRHRWELERKNAGGAWEEGVDHRGTEAQRKRARGFEEKALQ
jgi:hypothetical protein